MSRVPEESKEGEQEMNWIKDEKDVELFRSECAGWSLRTLESFICQTMASIKMRNIELQTMREVWLEKTEPTLKSNESKARMENRK